MAEKIENCSVGNIPQVNGECHQVIHTKKVCITLLSDLEKTDQRVIKLRVQSENIETICAHHYYVFFIHYANSLSQKKCCDPFSKHGKKTSKGVSVISLDLSDSVFTATGNIRLIPGKKLCPRCFKQAKDFLNDENIEPYVERDMICDSPLNSIDDDYNLNMPVTPRKVLSALADAFVISPIENITRLSKERRLNVFEKVIDSVKRNVMTESDGLPNLKLEDYSLLMTELRDKVKPVLCLLLFFHSRPGSLRKTY
jgi:hypothetical protein